MRNALGLLVVTSLLAACASSGSPPGATPLAASDDDGLTQAHAVEVCLPDGERDYLSRLICPSGEHPTFDRTGNVGPRTAIPGNMSRHAKDRMLQDNLEMTPLKAGEPDYHWIDAYEVTCGTTTTTVYMDMYHCQVDRPAKTPTGFGIVP